MFLKLGHLHIHEGNRIAPVLHSGNPELVSNCTLVIHSVEQNSALTIQGILARGMLIMINSANNIDS